MHIKLFYNKLNKFLLVSDKKEILILKANNNNKWKKV